jgi:hypothetical protein
VFISYEGHDRQRAKGFNLLRWNKNVDVEFVGRHLLDPVKSNNREYITRKIKEQIQGTSVTVVLLGKHTHESDWVAKEIRWSLEKEPPNGILAIRLDASASVPDEIKARGAEVINWNPHEFGDAIERAARAAGRAAVLARSGATGRGCIR